MRFFEVSFHCEQCGKPVAAKCLVREIHVQPGEPFDGICLGCDTGDDLFRVKEITKKEVLEGERLREWLKKFVKDENSGLYLLEPLIRYDNKRKPFLPSDVCVVRLEFVITPYPREEIPTSQKEWLTMSEIAAEFGVSVETVKTHKKRGKFDPYTAKGLTRIHMGKFQIHRAVAEEFYDQ